MTQAFNLSQFANNVNSSGLASLTTGVTGTLPIANGGTGTTTPALVAGTGITITGSFPNQTIAASGGGASGISGQSFTSNGTFTIPTGVAALKVTVVGGGGGGGNANDSDGAAWGGGGGGGGAAIKYLTGLTAGNTLAVTIGSGGGAASAGGTSQVASGTQSITTVSASGGGGGTSRVGGIGNGATGGIGSNGDANIRGGRGGTYWGCVGGDSLMGGISSPSITAFNSEGQADGQVGSIYGGGGSGCWTNTVAKTGGTGAAGIVTFEW